MPLSTIFAALSVATGAQLDVVLAELGVLTTIPCQVSGTNILALVPGPQTPTVVAYEAYQGFSCIASGNNTGAVTAGVGALGVLNVYADTPSGPTLLSGGEIVTGNLIILYYDPALDTGNGGFHLGGPGKPGSLLPPGGTVGQPLVNDGSGSGDWASDLIVDIITGTPGTSVQYQGGTDNGVQAGNAELIGGNSTAGGTAGAAVIQAGGSNTTGIAGGDVSISGGIPTVGTANGGNIQLRLGTGVGGGNPGQIKITNATSTPGSATGTLTNAPRASNPDIWLEVVIDGTVGWIPWWHA